MATPVKLVPLSPYDGQTGLMVPFVLERIKKAALDWSGEMDPIQLVARIGQRVYSCDPSIRLLAFVGGTGKLVGHAVASMETDGINTWVFVSQVKMDPGDWGDAIPRGLEEADKWAEWYSEAVLVPNGHKPISEMLMATSREDRGFIRRYGFKTYRHIMSRPVNHKGAKAEGSGATT